MSHQLWLHNNYRQHRGETLMEGGFPNLQIPQHTRSGRSPTQGGEMAGEVTISVDLTVEVW